METLFDTRDELDPDVFRAFVERYQDRVFRVVLSVLGPYREADAEDITQDVFLRAYRKRHQFRGDADPGTWLYRIAWTQALNARKRAIFRLPHLPVDTLEGVSLPDESHPGDPLARQALAECLEKLPDLYRTTLYMHYWLGATVSEISESLGIASGTIKSHLARGRSRLELCLNKKGVRHS